MKKTIIYSDLLNDDFSRVKLEKKGLNKKYKYSTRNPLFHLFSFIVYFIIARPIVFLILKIVFFHRFKNKKVIRQIKKSGAFLYANHTQGLIDSFVPNIISLRKNYIITNSDISNINFLSTLVYLLGAIPLPTTLSQQKSFMEVLEKRISAGKLITIYPEAHIWPYYTKIRPFDNRSFHYAAKFNCPIFTITNCYRKRLFIKFPKVISYIDGPFYPKENKTIHENMNILRDEAINAMIKRSNQYSNYEFVKYVKID